MVSFDTLDVVCTAMGVYEMLKVSLKSFISFTPLLELQENDDHTVILSKLAFTIGPKEHHWHGQLQSGFTEQLKFGG